MPWFYFLVSLTLLSCFTPLLREGSSPNNKMKGCDPSEAIIPPVSLAFCNTAPMMVYTSVLLLMKKRCLTAESLSSNTVFYLNRKQHNPTVLIPSTFTLTHCKRTLSAILSGSDVIFACRPIDLPPVTGKATFR